MSSIKKSIINFFLTLLCALFIYILINIVFFNKSSLSNINFLNLIVGIIIYLSISFIFYKIFEKYIKKKKRLLIIFFVAFIIFQILFSYIFKVKPSLWDFGDVNDIVMSDLFFGKNILKHWYFHRYSNNVGLALLLKYVFLPFKLLGFKMNYFILIGIGLNIIMIDISLLYLYKTLKLFLSDDNSKYFLICSLLVTPFITYCPIFYTDTLSMPFVIIPIYYFIKYFINDDKKNIYLILCGLLLGIGMCIKFTVLILLIAMIIYMIFYDDKVLSKIKKIFIIIFVMIIPYTCLNVIEANNFNKKILDREKFPVTHWVMMGLRENTVTGANGGYSQIDVDNTDKYKSVESKKEYNIKIIKERLSYYKENHKLVSFFTGKLVFVWGDGTFYAPTKLERGPIKNIEIKKYILGDEKDTIIYHTIAQSQIVLMLLFMIISIINRKYLNNKQKNILLLTSITIFGVILFFLLWEARSRYIINYIPIILIEVYLGVQSIINKYKGEVI